jgi:hypothetical protein
MADWGRLWRLLAAAALFTATAACSTSDCALGTDGCACTSGGQCDPGLACTEEGTCLSPSAGGGSAGAGRGLGFNEAEAATIEPLPETAFVFQRMVRQGDKLVSHICTFDLASNSERVISKLDQDIGRGDDIREMAVSPDRRWIAFSSVVFRITNADFKFMYFQDILWALSVDGKILRRLTGPPVAALNQSGIACAADSQCPGDDVCRSGKCVKNNFNIDYTNIVWAPDGKSVFFARGQWWLGGSLGIAGGTVIVAASVSGGEQRSTSGALREGCLLNGPHSFHPITGALLVTHNVCSGSTPEGFYEWGVDPFVRQRLLTRPPNLRSWGTAGSIAWLPDGRGFAFVAKNKEKQQYRDLLYEHRHGLYLWESEPMPHYEVVYEPPTDDIDVVDFGLSRSEVVVAEIRRKKPGVDGTFYELHLWNEDTRQFTQLPIAGLVRTPRW